MINGSFSERFKVVLGNALAETAMSGLTSWPASGSFIDVSGYEFVHIVAHLGTLDASDTPVLEPKCAEAVAGTLDRIDATLAHTCNVTTDDGDILMWSIEVRKLPLDHHFLALAVSGTLTNGSYIDVQFFLEGAPQPVTQGAYVVGDYDWLG
jgi:hypothetical protein